MQPSASSSRALPGVLRNASLLVIAQVAAIPVSVLVNAVAARTLGAATHWCQLRYANGGLGVCISCVASEVLMVIGGAWLLPAGIVPKIPRGRVTAGLAAGAAMAAVALSPNGLDAPLCAVLAVLAYFACLKLLGGASVPELRSLLGMLRSRQ